MNERVFSSPTLFCYYQKYRAMKMRYYMFRQYLARTENSALIWGLKRVLMQTYIIEDGINHLHYISFGKKLWPNNDGVIP